MFLVQMSLAQMSLAQTSLAQTSLAQTSLAQLSGAKRYSGPKVFGPNLKQPKWDKLFFPKIFTPWEASINDSNSGGRSVMKFWNKQSRGNFSETIIKNFGVILYLFQHVSFASRCHSRCYQATRRWFNGIHHHKCTFFRVKNCRPICNVRKNTSRPSRRLLYSKQR